MAASDAAQLKAAREDIKELLKSTYCHPIMVHNNIPSSSLSSLEELPVGGSRRRICLPLFYIVTCYPNQCFSDTICLYDIVLVSLAFYWADQWKLVPCTIALGCLVTICTNQCFCSYRQKQVYHVPVVILCCVNKLMLFTLFRSVWGGMILVPMTRILRTGHSEVELMEV